MDRVHALLLRDRDDALDVEIGADRSLPLADPVRFVRLETVEREAVFLGVDGDGAQAQFGGARKMRMAISLRLAAISFSVGTGIGVWLSGMARRNRLRRVPTGACDRRLYFAAFGTAWPARAP